MMLNVLAGYDRLDIASVEHRGGGLRRGAEAAGERFRIGIARAPFFDLLDADVSRRSSTTR